MPLHGVASVQPVTHRLKLAVGLLTHSLQLTQYPSVKLVLRHQLNQSRWTNYIAVTLSHLADVIAPMLCSGGYRFFWC